MFARWFMRLVPFLLTLLISFLSLWIWWRGEKDITQQAEYRLEREASRLGGSFRRHLRGQRAILMSSQGLIASQPMITATEWRLFHDVLVPAGLHDGLQAVFFFQTATTAQLAPLEIQQRVLHGGDFAYKGKTAESDRHLIGVQGATLAMTGQGFAKHASDALLQSFMGLDLLAEGSPLYGDSALSDAITLEQTRITQAIPLATGTGIVSAHLLVMPVFKDSWTAGTTSDRWAALRGVVVGVADMAMLAEKVASGGEEDLRFALYDAGLGLNGDVAQAALVWDARAGKDWAETSAFERSTTVFFGGRSWLIRVGASKDAFGQGELRSANLIHSLSGIIIAFLVGGVAWLLVVRREQAEQQVAGVTIALKHSEARYSQLFRHNRAVELLIDPNTGAIVDANEAAAVFYGWRRDQLCAMSIYDIDSAPVEVTKGEVQKAHLEQKADFYVRHRLSNGQTRHVEIHAGPITVDLGDGHGARKLLYCVVHDITERAKAEQALTASEAQFRVLFEKSPLAIQLINAQGSTVRVNQAWEHLWKQSSATVIRSGKSLLSDPQLQEVGVAACLHKALAGEVVEIPPFNYSLPGLGAHGLWLHAFAYPIPQDGDETGQAAVIIIYDNVTDTFHQQQRLKRTLDDLQRSNEELEQFAYVASHDLQEPLRMVSSYLSLLSKRYGESFNAEAREFMDFALDGAHRMQDLIRDLLDYARIGRVDSAADVIDSRRALDEAQAELTVAIEKSEAKISHGFLPYVAIDTGELTRLFSNLLGNAIKYAKPGVAPIIHVEARRQDDMWRFTVDDNGPGIDPENHEKIFKIFQRLHAAGHSSGTGIGLAICRKIVEHNGGQMGVQSQVGSGSCFWFTLPVHADHDSFAVPSSSDDA